MTNPHILKLMNFLRDFADANADSFAPEQIDYLNQSAIAIVILDQAVDELVKERDDAFKQIDELQDVCGDSADRMVELRKERDEARRMYCELYAVMHGRTPSYVANSLDWDCVKEDSDAEESH